MTTHDDQSEFGPATATRRAKGRPGCLWIPDDDGVYETACGHAFVVTEGAAEENGMRFCPYCGGALQDEGRAREYRRKKSTAAKSTHRRHTYCGVKFCVPMFLHEAFANQLGEQGLAKFDLLEWYPTLDARYEAIPIGGDILAWVRKEFTEATKALFGDPAQIRRNRMGVR